MAQPTDLTGMLTEGLFQPTQKAVPSSYRESILGAAQSAGTGLRRGIGALTGADTRTNPEAARAAMQGLDINNPADQPKILEIVRKYAPEREAALVAQFAQQGRVRAEKEKVLASKKERQGNFLKFLTERHPDLLSLASGDNPVVTPENYKEYLKVDGTKLTDDQKEYAQAINEGYKGTFIQYLDRNSKIGGANLTSEQKHLAQINQENKARGLPEISLSSFLEKKSATTANLPDKVKIYEEAVRNGEWPANDYLGWQQALAKATRAPSKDDERKTTKDKSGFMRYVDDGTLVFPEVVKQLKKDADAEKQKNEQKKEATLEYLRTAGMTVLADNLERGVYDADSALELADVDPKITTLANDHLQTSIDLAGQSSSAIDILLSYNEKLEKGKFKVGKPAEIKRQVKAIFGAGDGDRLLSFQYAEGRIKESNILMPTGSVTEMEVRRSDATQPEITESPEVVRGYLYGKAKKNALGAAQANALQKWMINYQGNTAGFVDYWMGVINDDAKLQAIFDKAGIPPNQNFKRKVISGSNI